MSTVVAAPSPDDAVSINPKPLSLPGVDPALLRHAGVSVSAALLTGHTMTRLLAGNAESQAFSAIRLPGDGGTCVIEHVSPGGYCVRLTGDQLTRERQVPEEVVGLVSARILDEIARAAASKLGLAARFVRPHIRVVSVEYRGERTLRAIPADEAEGARWNTPAMHGKKGFGTVASVLAAHGQKLLEVLATDPTMFLGEYRRLTTQSTAYRMKWGEAYELTDSAGDKFVCPRTHSMWSARQHPQAEREVAMLEKALNHPLKHGYFHGMVFVENSVREANAFVVDSPGSLLIYAPPGTEVTFRLYGGSVSGLPGCTAGRDRDGNFYARPLEGAADIHFYPMSYQPREMYIDPLVRRVDPSEGELPVLPALVVDMTDPSGGKK